MARELINTAGAFTSGTFTVLRPDIAFSVVASGLAGGEVVNLQVNQGGTYTNVYLNGSLIQLTSTHNIFPIDIIGNYRMVKGATAGVVLVTLNTNSETGV